MTNANVGPKEEPKTATPATVSPAPEQAPTEKMTPKPAAPQK
jgi:hypothetical protein